MPETRPQLSQFTKNAARAVVTSDIGLTALQFALGRLDRHRASHDKARRLDDAVDVIYSALYQEHRRRINTLLRLLLATNEIDQAKALAWDDFKGGHVSHLGVAELKEADIIDGKEEEELLGALRESLLRDGP